METKANQDIEPIASIHLVFTSIITEKRRRIHTGTLEIESRNRVSIFLSVLESIRELPITTADFYIKLDETTIWAENEIRAAIFSLPFNTELKDWRLETFEDWKLASSTIRTQNANQIMLFANDDHININSNSEEFIRCSRAQIMANHDLPNKSIMVLLSHFPEVHGVIPISKSTRSLLKYHEDYLVPVITPIGAVLMSPKDFSAWFIEDFTNGKMFVGPENPFGPSLSLSNAYYLVPRFELFRHLDAYSHVRIMGWPYQVMDSPINIIKGELRSRKEFNSWYFTSSIDEPDNKSERTYLLDTKNRNDIKGFAASLVKASAVRPSIQTVRAINLTYGLSRIQLFKALCYAFVRSRRFRFSHFRVLAEFPILLSIYLYFGIHKKRLQKFRMSIKFNNLLGAASFGLIEYYVFSKIRSCLSKSKKKLTKGRF
jgi:hypothetical protein